jgi:hypothetical protein
MRPERSESLTWPDFRRVFLACCERASCASCCGRRALDDYIVYLKEQKSAAKTPGQKGYSEDELSMAWHSRRCPPDDSIRRHAGLPTTIRGVPRPELGQKKRKNRSGCAVVSEVMNCSQLMHFPIPTSQCPMPAAYQIG